MSTSLFPSGPIFLPFCHHLYDIGMISSIDPQEKGLGCFAQTCDAKKGDVQEVKKYMCRPDWPAAAAM